MEMLQGDRELSGEGNLCRVTLFHVLGRRILSRLQCSKEFMLVFK